MLLFELKKIVSKTSNRLALLLLAAVLCVVCWQTISGVSYVKENGKSISGFKAIKENKKTKTEWQGDLTEQRIAEVIAENLRINKSEEALSGNLLQNEISYSWKQGYMDIYRLLIRSYCGFTDYDYYKPDTLKPQDSERFYSNRTANLKEWLGTAAKYYYSDSEKSYLIGQYETLKTPLSYGYADGWIRFSEFSVKIIMITVLVLGFLSSGIFSGEFSLKSDSIFFSSACGRGKAVSAKVKAGILLVTGVYWVMILAYSLFVFVIFGADGANLPIQINSDTWKSFYHLTFLQEYFIITVGGYLGSLFISLLAMLVSAKSRSAVLAVIVPFLLIFLPSFLSGGSSPVIAKLLGLLPDQLLQMNKTVMLFNLYHIGGRIWGGVGLLLVLYTLLTALLCPILYYLYCKSEVK